MRAHVGDRIVVASRTTGTAPRDGEIVEVRGADGAPPYMVRWSDKGSTGLFFPGADAHLSEGVEHQHTEAGAAGGSAVAPHVRSWRVDIDLFEAGDDTTAHAVLVAESPRKLDARGEAHRNPRDLDVPEIGDEVAVARALRRLSDRLLETASLDMSGVEAQRANAGE